jgi:hypothetical protein
LAVLDGEHEYLAGPGHRRIIARFGAAAKARSPTNPAKERIQSRLAGFVGHVT